MSMFGWYSPREVVGLKQEIKELKQRLNVSYQKKYYISKKAAELTEKIRTKSRNHSLAGKRVWASKTPEQRAEWVKNIQKSKNNGEQNVIQ